MTTDGEPRRSCELVPSPATGSLSGVRRIGEGGSAEVFAAVWRGREVAMKVAKPGTFEDARDKERFLEEAQRLSRIDHPGVIEVLDTGELPDGRPYLLMPLLEGETLDDRIARGPLPVPIACSLFMDVAEALEALHVGGLIHRDLKPGNIFLPEGEARPILLDLGIAKELDATASTLTQAGVIRGTPAVMAPERFFGTPASVASDIYELAVVLYAMLVGRLPWDNPTNVEARLFPRLPAEQQVDVPDAMADALMMALSTRPERRPASASAFAEQVERSMRDGAQPRHEAQRPATEKVPARSEMPDADTPNAASFRRRPGAPVTGRSRRASLVWLAVAVAGTGGLLAAWTSTGGHPAPPASTVVSTTAAPVESPAGTSAPATSLRAPGTGADASIPSASPPGSSSMRVAASPSPPPLPTPSWALPRRTRHQELVWCNQIVDEVCDPELIDRNANARTACQEEMNRLKRIQAGPRSAWSAANEDCHNRHGAIRGVAQLEKSARRDEIRASMRAATSAAASAFPSPAPDATLDAWLARLPSCRAYAAFFCSQRVRDFRGDFGCHAARNAVHTIARNAARYGPETLAQHERSCRLMLEQDRAAVLAEMNLENTLHPPAAASPGSSPGSSNTGSNKP